MRTLVVAIAMGVLASACVGPPGTYCQTGPKYGTQCYAEDPDDRRDPGEPGPDGTSRK